MSCATGAAHSNVTPRPPHPLDMAVQWRPSQELAIAKILAAAETGASRLHLVAPPGAGKTWMGLYVALALGRPIVALANTRGIAEQWRAACVQNVVALEGRFSGAIADRVVTELPGTQDRLPLLLATTYQAWTRQRPDKLQRGASVRERLAPSVLGLHDRYAAAGALLILDECHHLLAWWAEVIEHQQQTFEELVTLGLTATPPHDAPAEQRRRYSAIVGPISAEIPLVAAVREQALAPFQDLALFVRPDQAEEAAIAGVDAAWSAWLASARPSWHGDESAIGAASSTLWLPGLDAHVRARTTVSPGRRRLAFSDFLSLCEREPSFAMALGRWLLAHDLEVPAEVYPLAEMSFAPSRQDVLALVDDYVVTVLAPLIEPSPGEAPGTDAPEADLDRADAADADAADADAGP